MEKVFEFNPKNHSYTLDGKRMTGCTTILGIIAKPALIQWAADLAAISALEAPQIKGIKAEYEAIQEIKDYRQKKIAKDKLKEKYPTYKEARLAHRKKKEGAADIGKMAHKMIENWINGKDVVQDVEGYSKLTSEEMKKIHKMFSNFTNWAKENKVEFLQSEKIVYSESEFIAGTADFTCLIDGKKYIGDIKTTNGIFDRTPLFQTAGYRFMLEEMGEKDFVGSVIVNIKKDGTFDSEKNVYFSEDYQEDLDGFLAALKLYRVLNNCVMK